MIRNEEMRIEAAEVPPRRAKGQRRMSAFDFCGKRVLVTGASHGIGFAVAAAFARAGAELAILSSTRDIKEAAARDRQGARPTGARRDLRHHRPRRRPPVRRRARRARRARQQCRAGAGHADVEPGDAVEKTFARIIEINVIGTYYVTRDALPLMRDGGSIVLTSSIWGKTGAADFAAYVTSKHANIGFMRVLAKELGPKGIRVNAVCPGWVRTRAALRSLDEGVRRCRDRRGRRCSADPRGQALPGLMEPDDVASLYLFLASDHAKNITGQAVNVDRGDTMV